MIMQRTIQKSNTGTLFFYIDGYAVTPENGSNLQEGEVVDVNYNNYAPIVEVGKDFTCGENDYLEQWIFHK